MSEMKSEVARREEEILAFWKERGIFEKTLEKRAPRGEFTFYDGPPFATGLPHHGSLLSSIIKDVIPRYKTMQGYRVPRVWGWDCHGLPIENLIEKRLNLKTKKDIIAVGIDVFNEAARSAVLQYVHDWEYYVDRVGRWVDFKNSYKTMDNSYIETVWWALREMQSKKLLYEGRKVLMYCTHCETPLAKAEIAADNTYKDVTEEAVTVKFKLKAPQKFGLPDNTYLLAWTTTPWTLPGNVGLAVGPDIPYVLLEHNGEFL
ncbi:MAG TPA: class I tRNA ligase family protein, partial [Candidatus Paceibacterota bacterium]|nr:class I tRNA ligase family protein [Candidatus Paceibacterota bacterium]